MGLMDFVLAVVGVTAAVMILRGDVKKSATTFRRNVRQIRHWLEEESESASKAVKKWTSEEIKSLMPKKDKS